MTKEDIIEQSLLSYSKCGVKKQQKILKITAQLLIQVNGKELSK